MNRTLAVLTLTGGLALIPAAAHAHHPLVTGVATCDTTTGLFDLAWTVTSDDPTRGKQWKVRTNPAVGIPTGFQPESEPFTGAQDDVAAGTYELVVKATWKGGPGKVTTKGSVTAGGPCEKDRPEQPEPVVATASSEAIDCDTRTVTTVTTTTTTGWVFDESSWSWVPGEPVTTETSTVRDATAQDCPVTTPTPPPAAPEPPVPPVTPPLAPEAPEARAVPELAHTGFGSWVLGLAGLGLIGAGSILVGRKS